MRTLRWLIAVGILLGTALGAMLFVAENGETTFLHVPLLRTFEAPLWLLVTASFFLGAFAASAGLLFQLARKSLAARRSEKRAKRLEAELAQLRAAAPAIAGGDAAPQVRSTP